MDFLIGSITALLLITLFRFFEKKRVERLGKTTYLFFFYVVVCSSFMKPSEEIWLWLIFSLLLYSVLDDMKTKTMNIYFPIIASLLFFFFLEKPYFFLYSFFFFFCFLVFTKITKEKFIGEGDSYLSLPLLVMLLIHVSDTHWSFVAEQWLFASLLSVLLAAVIAIPLKLFQRKLEELAFGPFLVLGSAITYHDAPWVTVFLSYLLISTMLLYVIWLVTIFVSFIIKKIRSKK